MLYNINSLRVGLKIIYNNEPGIIVGNECVKPGKGQSFNRVRFKQILSGKIIEKTLKSGEFLKSADVVDLKLIYLYKNEKLWYFMYEQNFEQIEINYDVIRENIKWMQEQLYYNVTFWNEIPILVTPPDLMQLKIVKISSMTKRVSNPVGSKLAKVNTGAVIKVPGFIKVGEIIKVNTRLGTYISRVK